MGIKEDILKADDLKTIKVEVKDWNVTVKLVELTGAELEQWESASRLPTAISGVTLGKLVALSIRNDDGMRVFSDAEIGKLTAKSHKSLMVVYKAALKPNGLSEEAKTELEKN